MTSNIISYSCGYFAMSSLSKFCLFSFLWANPFQSNCSILYEGEHASNGAQQIMLGLKEKKKGKTVKLELGSVLVSAEKYYQ